MALQHVLLSRIARVTRILLTAIISMTVPSGALIAEIKPESTKPNTYMTTAFIDASSEGKLEVMKQLLNSDLKDSQDATRRAQFVDTLDATDRTALTEAVASDHQSVIRWLLRQGADPDLRGQHHLRPIAIAVLYRRFYIARMLLKEGAYPNPKDVYGNSPMHYAARSGDIRLMHLLLRYEANINMINVNRVTPLMEAVKHDGIESVKFLIENRANPYLTDKHGMTASQRARRLERSDITELLDENLALWERKKQANSD